MRPLWRRLAMFPEFRRLMRYGWRFRWLVTFSVLLSIVVSALYALTIATLLPLFAVMFSDRQSVSQMLYSHLAEHRLRARTELSNSGDEVVLANFPGDGQYGVLLEPSLEELSRLDADRTLIKVQPITADGDAIGEPQVINHNIKRLPLYGGSAALVADILPAERTPEARFRVLLIVCLALVLVVTAGAVARTLQRFCVTKLAARSLLDMRTDLFGRLLLAPLLETRRYAAGDMVSRLVQDAAIVEQGLRAVYGRLLMEPMRAAAAIWLAWTIDHRLLLAVLLLAAPSWALFRFLGKQSRRAQRKASRAWSDLSTRVHDRLSALGVVKVHGAEGREKHAFFRESRQLHEADMRGAWVDAAANPLAESLVAICITVFLIFGGYLVFYGAVSPGGLLTAVVCVLAIYEPIRRLSSAYGLLQRANAAARRINELFDLRDEPSVEPPVDRLAPLKTAITLNDVDFAYPDAPETRVLRGVTLEIPAGKTTAIVGPNGSGKTTLVGLLLRFYEPRTGTLLWDGIPHDSIPMRQWRGRFGVVLQDGVIFAGTVADAIRYGRPHASLSTLETAAKLAGAERMFEPGNAAAMRAASGPNATTSITPLSNGDLLQTSVEHRRLSGGQRQRLAIARALAREPDVLVFDEATSEIDGQSEAWIRQALQQAAAERTVLIVAHRAQTVRQADRIIVLDGGQVVDVGQHAELMARCAIYRQLFGGD